MRAQSSETAPDAGTDSASLVPQVGDRDTDKGTSGTSSHSLYTSLYTALPKQVGTAEAGPAKVSPQVGDTGEGQSEWISDGGRQGGEGHGHGAGLGRCSCP